MTPREVHEHHRRTPSALAPSTVTQRFEIARGGGRAFAKLTGDYNPIHLWPWYARRMRFPDAFSHPQRAAGMCLARLPRPDSDAQTLDLWIKGPVFYGANVTLGSATADGGTEFGLVLEGDHRPALSGWWGRRSNALDRLVS
jgi:acyl dehydratase